MIQIKNILEIKLNNISFYILPAVYTEDPVPE